MDLIGGSLAGISLRLLLCRHCRAIAFGFPPFPRGGLIKGHIRCSAVFTGRRSWRGAATGLDPACDGCRRGHVGFTRVRVNRLARRSASWRSEAGGTLHETDRPRQPRANPGWLSLVSCGRGTRVPEPSHLPSFSLMVGELVNTVNPDGPAQPPIPAQQWRDELDSGKGYVVNTRLSTSIPPNRRTEEAIRQTSNRVAQIRNGTSGSA